MEHPSSEPEPGDALDQLKDISDGVEDSWRFVIYCLQKATYELIDVDDDTRVALELDFWAEHVALLERVEAQQPGTAERVMTRFEEIAAELREAERSHFDKELRKRKRKAFVRGMLFLKDDPITYDEIMASRKPGSEIANL